MSARALIFAAAAPQPQPGLRVLWAVMLVAVLCVDLIEMAPDPRVEALRAGGAE